MYRNAVFYFIGLLLILIGGFWTSYFSRLGGDVSFGQHFHGISMLSWVLLLITQAWFIRTNRRSVHRAAGKISFVLAPLVVWSGLFVVLDSIGKDEIPYSQVALSVFSFGLFLIFLFAVVYGLAIYHRKNMQLHARYMACTALAFLVPGLLRLFGKIGSTFDIWMPNFSQTIWVPGIIALILIFDDWRKGQIRKPYVVVTGLWALGMIGFYNLYKFAWWTDFANWYRSFG